MKRPTLSLILASLCCASFGCTLEEVQKPGEHCPPQIFVNDLEDPPYVICLVKEGNEYRPKNCDYSALPSSGKVLYDPEMPLMKYSMVKDYFSNGGEMTLGYIEGHADFSAYPSAKENSLCPQEYALCNFSTEEQAFFCKRPECVRISDCHKFTGWESGICQNGQCVIESCQSGYELKDGKCVALECSAGEHPYVNLETSKKTCEPDDVENCGSHGYNCSLKIPGWVSGECAEGACIATQCDADAGYALEDGKCLAACIGSQVKCGGLCRDPMTDNEYCGATGTINSCESEGTKCEGGKVCVGGTCLQNTCSGEQPDLCEITHEDGSKSNECRNVKSDDVEHCGACNYVCANNPTLTATSSVCLNGVCQYECKPGYTQCGNSTSAESIICVKDEDFLTDQNHCGGCNIACQSGEACAEGVCVQNSCKGDKPDLCVVEGQNVCKNTKGTDAENCGACGHVCANNPATNASSNTCKEGVCQYTCNSGYTNCGGVTAASINCIKTTDLQTDGQNCGSCGNVCGAGKACAGGKCVQNSCSGTNPDLCVVDGKNVCKNTKSNDAANCGACNYACANNPATNASSSTCKAGVCQYTCDSGYTNCGGVTASSIRCIKTTDMQTDGQNCGTCGKVCGAGEACVGGKCVQNSCSGASPDLCVVGGQNVCKNTKSNDAAHCGACNYACANNPVANATSNTCKAGVCQYTCDSGYTNCGYGTTAASINCIKTTNLQSDSQNCGSCGNVCGTGKACVYGKCVPNSCSGSTPDLCVVGGQNVCKKVSGNDASHCGACNYSCANNPATNASSNTCRDGVCQYTCDSGYTNCGGNTAASINCIKTTDLQTNGQNCGSCGNVCGTGKACVGGKCVQNSCSGSTPDLCVVGGQNVCKNTHSTDKAHCGACNYECANNPVANATSNTCKDGICQYTCNTGYTNCGGVTAASINCIKTTNLQSDSQNCGTCGKQCYTGEACVAGKCVPNSCSGSTPDLCVVSGQNVCKNTRSNDAAHCGACNYSCANNPVANATSNTCSAGVCQYTCNSGYVNCGGSTAASINCIKTTDLQTDGQNCGSCGNVCGTGKACVGGKCVQNSCSGSTPDLCVVNGQNVCKNTRSNDADHCGACNYKCAYNPATNATSSTCKDGVCQYTCNSGYTNCGGVTAASINCIKTTDLQTDGQNCGACGNKCGTGKACVGGKCVQNSCSGSTPDLCVVGGQNVCKRVSGTDAAHCGACNYACANNPVANATSNTCSAGVCQYTCNSGYTNCGGNTAASINCIKTTDLQTDGQNCGSCGNACSAGKACIGGMCVTNSCSGVTPDLCVVSGTNTCKNINGTDSDHCGACNYRCSSNPVANATSNTCTAGVCQYTCNSGYTNCGYGATAASINCIKTTNLQSDSQNCGMCNNICGTGKACVGGKCVQNSCSGSTPDLCVVNGTNTCKKINGTDANHCGACNYACANNPVANATSNTCTAGVCQYTCNTGYVNCGGSTAASINCVRTEYLQNDPNNCGACGVKCISGNVCIYGVCTIGCPTGQTACYGQCYTTSILSSIFHMNSDCSCMSGYTNANSDWADGCEAH